MKKQIKALIAVSALTLSLSSFAQDASTVDITLSPVYSAVATVQSALETVLSPFASTSATTVAAARIDMEAVEQDAINYLAGEEKTIMLDEVISVIRENSGEELVNASDKEVALTILEAIM